MIYLMNEETYTLKEVSRKLSLSLRDKDLHLIDRQIKHWTSNDLLKTVGDKHTGTGRSRVYAKEEIYVAGYLQELTKYGLTIGVLSNFRKKYNQWLKDKRLCDLLHGKGDKIGRSGHIVCQAFSGRGGGGYAFNVKSAEELSHLEVVGYIENETEGIDLVCRSALIINCGDIIRHIDRI
jgi:hypothetical protein